MRSMVIRYARSVQYQMKAAGAGVRGSMGGGIAPCCRRFWSRTSGPRGP